MKILPNAAFLFAKLPRVLRRHRLMKAWMRMTGEPAVQLVRIRDNAFGYADMNDGFLRLIVIEQDFENDFFRIADSILNRGGTFLDVGANHGLLSFGLAGRHGNKIDFHIFEPNAKLVQSIHMTKSLYTAMRLRVNQVAVSDQEGIVSFQINETQSGASHINDDSEGLEVRCISLDNYFEKVSINKVDLLKVDVEGYELKALRGAKKALETRRIEAVYFEYFEKFLVRVSPPTDLIAFFNSVGYEVCFCRAGDYGPRGGANCVLADKGVLLLPVERFSLPAMTDLIAVPKDRLIFL